MNEQERLVMDAFLYAQEGERPENAIDDQAKRGARKVETMCLLPVRANSDLPGNCDIVEQYGRMGIKILDKYDDLFYKVELPMGWEIKNADHPYWNNLLIDNEGRKRASFFYKAAIYNMDAFINFTHRYSYSVLPFDEYKTDATYTDRKFKPWKAVITDNGEPIKKLKEVTPNTQTESLELGKELRIIAIDYLNENYPFWEDINAYWDDFEFECNMDKTFYESTESYDEWGCAFLWHKSGINAEYNFCIDKSSKSTINNSAIYKVVKEDDEMITEYDTFIHYEVDFGDMNWEYHLREAMKKMVLGFLEIKNTEQLVENWAVSSYAERTQHEMNYYINENDCSKGSIGYLRLYDEDLGWYVYKKLEIVHIIRRSKDSCLYDLLKYNRDILRNGEKIYKADTSAEFHTSKKVDGRFQYESYLVWFNYV